MDCVVKLTKAFGVQNFGAVFKMIYLVLLSYSFIKNYNDDVEIPKPQIVYPQIAFENNSAQSKSIMNDLTSLIT